MMKSRIWIVALALVAAAGTAACGSSSSNASGTGGNSSTGGASGAGGASASDAGPDAGGGITALPAGWNKIQPGGRTRCARGQPWEFYVRPGTVNKVVVEFEGGASCWNAQTCLPGAHMFVDYLRIPPEMKDESVATGLLDHADPRNPFRDWNHVFVPYCTGDWGWGDSDHQYTSGSTTFTVMHRGAVNVQAVLDWMKDNVKDPSEVVSTGSSAGSATSIMWAPALAQQYPQAKVTQIADSGVGVVPANHIPTVEAAWNVAEAFQRIFPGADVSKITSSSDVYALVHSKYPDIQLSAFDTDFDSVQISQSALMGFVGDANAWSKAMHANLDAIASAVPSFRSYTAPGWKHGLLEFPQAYTVKSEGVTFTDWVTALLARNAQSVDCGTHCGGPYGASGSSGWQCVGSASATPAPLDADLDVSLLINRYDPPTFDRFSGLSVSACAGGDQKCASPLAQATTNSAGRVTLHVPTGKNGFDGYFLFKGANTPERFFVRPAIRNMQHPMVGDSYGWGVPNTTDLTNLAADAGVTYDPNKGVIVAQVFDCNLSKRSDVSADLDGAAPTAFAGPPSWVPNQTPGFYYMWFNVAPGSHSVNVSLPGSTTPIASENVYVDAGGFTVLTGVSPQTVQPE